MTTNTTEEYLEGYATAIRDINRLRNDRDDALKKCLAAYEGKGRNVSYDAAIQKSLGRRSEVEKIVIRIVDDLREDVRAIEERLTEAKVKRDTILHTVRIAKLNDRETLYVELRYFKGFSAEQTAQKMYCSPRTCVNIRATALEKIERARTCIKVQG